MTNYNRRGTYIGPAPHLKGATALLRDHTAPDQVLAQFDLLGTQHAGVDVSHKWHAFPAADFLEHTGVE